MDVDNFATGGGGGVDDNKNNSNFANNNDNNMNESLLEQAMEAAWDPRMQSLQCAEILLSVLAVLLNVLVMANVPRVTVFHTNLRCLMFHHSFCLGLMCGSTAVKSAFSLVSGWTRAYENMVMRVNDCKLVDLFYTAPLLASMQNLAALTLERLYATVRRRSYDVGVSRPWLAALLILIMWTANLLTLGLPALSDAGRNTYVVMCGGLVTIAVNRIRSFAIDYLSFEAVTVALTVLLYLINYRLSQSIGNRSRHNLTVRFQISQNVEVNRMLLPSALLHCLCITLKYGYLFVISGVDVDRLTQLFLLHINQAWTMFYAVGHPTLVFLLIPHMRKLFMPRLFRCDFFRRPRRTNMVADLQSDNEHHKHFEFLNRMWQSAVPRRSSRNCCVWLSESVIGNC